MEKDKDMEGHCLHTTGISWRSLSETHYNIGYMHMCSNARGLYMYLSSVVVISLHLPLKHKAIVLLAPCSNR